MTAITFISWPHLKTLAAPVEPAHVYRASRAGEFLALVLGHEGIAAPAEAARPEGAETGPRFLQRIDLRCDVAEVGSHKRSLERFSSLASSGRSPASRAPPLRSAGSSRLKSLQKSMRSLSPRIMAVWSSEPPDVPTPLFLLKSPKSRLFS